MKWRKLDKSNELNFFSLDSKVIGDLRSEADIRVDGHLVGDIISSGQVVVGEMALIIGNIEADTLVIYGEVIGEYHVANVFKVASTGRYQGNIRAGTLEIGFGAIVEGKISRISHEIPKYDTEGVRQLYVK